MQGIGVSKGSSLERGDLISKERKNKLEDIGLFRIIERIGPVAYPLELPSELSRIHNVFHVSMLRKYVPDPSHALEAPPIELNEDLSFEMQPVDIMDQGIKELRNKIIPMVKVLWRSIIIEETTWETEAFMRKYHPYLFNT